MNDILVKVISIILMMALGYIIKLTKMLKEESVRDIEKFVLDLALPALIFLKFAGMEIKKENIFIFIIIFALLMLYYFIGIIINKIKGISHILLPFIVSGFAFGLIGIPLFRTVFGDENLDKFILIGIANDVFIWVFYMEALRNKLTNEGISLNGFRNVIKSPIVISVVIGIVFNIFGITEYFSKYTVLKGIDATIQAVADIGTPLVLIIVGFRLRFSKDYLKQSVKFILIRYIILFTVGYAVKMLILDRIIGDDVMFGYAFFTLLSLPVPYSMGIVGNQYSSKENSELFANTAVLNTIIGIIIYITFTIIVTR